MDDSPWERRGTTPLNKILEESQNFRDFRALERIVEKKNKITAIKILIKFNIYLNNSVSTNIVCRELHKDRFLLGNMLLSNKSIGKHLEWSRNVQKVISPINYQLLYSKPQVICMYGDRQRKNLTQTFFYQLQQWDGSVWFDLRTYILGIHWS